MSKVLAFFKRRWVISLLGLIAFAALIWFIGPLIAIAGRVPLGSSLIRTVVILVLFSIWLGLTLWRWFSAKRADLQLMMQMAKSSPAESKREDGSAQEIAVLRQRFEEALAVLKKARLGGRQGRQFLYQLPWYVIIGAPGSGKTTALVNSELHFPLAERFGKREIGGVGGTRNCDWFFTDEAVLIDTAGRYTTQDSHETTDKAAWQGFLSLLKKYRSRRPITGILVAASISDLLQQDERERAAQARAIRQRIQELHEQLGIRFPIYVWFTKCDLLAGFTQFFDDLGKEERTQVWGTSFPLVEPDQTGTSLNLFAAEFSELEKQLNARLTPRLQTERDPQRRALIYAFPQQFSGLKEPAQRFLTDVFQPTKFEENAWLRGVYFTSGTQEGTPIDRVMGALAATFGVDRRSIASQSGSGRSYFITKLLRDVVFLESGLAGTNLKYERKRLWVQRGAYAGALLLSGLIAVLWLTSYTRNKLLISNVAEKVEAVRQQIKATPNQRGAVLAALPLLNTVRELPGGYAEGTGIVPAVMGFGLYQGEKLGEGAKDLYARLLHDMFLARLLERLEDQIRQGINSPEALYGALKTYLMLHQPDRFRANEIKLWFAKDWERSSNKDITVEQRDQLLGHVDALLEQGPLEAPIAADTGLVQQAQAVLSRVPTTQRIYQRLKSEHLADEQPPEFRISEAAGRDGALVLSRKSGAPLSKGIPGLYTYKGYHEIFRKDLSRLIKEADSESWVYGTSPVLVDAQAQQRLYEDVCRSYLEDYIKQWDQLVNDVTATSFDSLPQAAQTLSVLSGAQSPLRLFLAAVDKETTLEIPTDAASKEEKPDEKGLIDRARELVQSKLPADLNGSALPNCSPAQLQYVQSHYAAIGQQIKPAGQGGAAPIDSAFTALNNLQSLASSIANAPNPTEAAKLAASNGQLNQALNQAKAEAGRAPALVGGVLQNAAGGVARLTMGNTRTQLNSIWTSQVYAFFKAGISGRYPLVKAASQESTVEDFTRFFGPTGLMEDFFQKQLANLTDTSGNTWRWRQEGSAQLGISDNTLGQFRNARMIKEGFFPGGAQAVQMRFQLTPISMDASITRFTLDLDGQVVTYSHEPPRPFPLQWPGPNSTRQVRVEISPPANNGNSGFTVGGYWSWLRALDRARLESTSSPERYRLTFDVEGHKAVFELTASSVLNPFRLPALTLFRCPERL